MDLDRTRERLADYISRELEYWDFSGVVSVVRGGKPLFEASRGYASVEFGVKNTSSTRFTLASVTKQFTAFGVMLLWDRGLLSLDADANRYLPADLRLPPGITVHDLLAHTSGLYNGYNFEDDFYVGADRLPYDRGTFFHDWIVRKPQSPPGVEFSYNNFNYSLLAWIIENVGGRPYAEFLQENIFRPLGMTDTECDDGMNILPNRANNYMHDYGRLVRVPYVNPLFGIGAGNLVSTCADLLKWYECLRRQKLLSAPSYRRFFTENKNHYCYGLERGYLNGTTKYAHGGDFNGVATYAQYFFEDDLCILVLSNTESLNQYRLGNAIAEILYGGNPPPGRRPEEVPFPEEELEKFTGTYLPGKIQMEVKDGTLYLVRVNQKIHIGLYCVGPNAFLRRWEESGSPHILLREGAEKPSVWGFELLCKELI